MNNIEVPSQLMGISTKVDGSLSLRFVTGELNSEDKLAILENQNMPGYLLFAPNQFSDKDIPKEDAPEIGKSQSERLRNVIFVYWKDIKKSERDFNQFYRNQIEKIIEKYKEKLSERG